ncbi:ferritin-like domain-containing protein [Parasphingorhabdus pacifica]
MSDLQEKTANALRAALKAEHTALWVYGLAEAFLGTDTRSAADEATAEHRERRNAAERALRDANLTPPPGAPAYRLPESIEDADSAVRMLITSENDCQVGWRAVLESTDNAALRRTALKGLTTSATRATRWRLHAGQQPSATAFPGKP